MAEKDYQWALRGSASDGGESRGRYRQDQRDQGS